jgi:hypothetical protein
MNRDRLVSHDREDETSEAKALWFRSLSMSERIRILCEVTDLALSLNPSLPEKRRTEAIPGRVQVISAPGREVRGDLGA